MILPVYLEIFEKLVQMGIEWINLDEPILTVELPSTWQYLILESIASLSGRGIKIMLNSGIGSIAPNAELVKQLPYEGIHLDCVTAPQQLSTFREYLDSDTVLSVGIVDGNIASPPVSTSQETAAKLRPLADALTDRLWLAPHCSLIHYPEPSEQTNKLDVMLGKHKLNELAEIKKLLGSL